MLKEVVKSSQFMNILYNLVKIEADEGKLVKYFSLFQSIFCYSSLTFISHYIGSIQLTTLQNLLNGNAISLILSFCNMQIYLMLHNS